MEQVLVIFVIALVLVFAFINGFHDGFNVIANSVLSRSIDAPKALWIACAASFLGALFLGSAVAVTIGREIFDTAFLREGGRVASMLFVLSGLVSASVWCLMTWWVGMPPSSSHALIGGLLGGGLAAFGLDVINWTPLFNRVFLVLFASPLIVIILAWAFMRMIKVSPGRSRAGAGDLFQRRQWLSLVWLSAGHGTNNAQKAMGVLSMVMMIRGSIKAFYVPGWVALGCAISLSLGVAAGGWKLFKVFMDRKFRIEPVHAFNAHLAGGTAIFLAGLIGGPISTTQIVKSAIIGVGVGHRKRPVRMMLLKDMMFAWLLTVPASAFLAATFYWIASASLGQGMGSFERIMNFFGQ